MVDDHDVPALDLATQDPLDGVLLGLKDHSRSGEGKDRGVHASGLDDAALLRDVAEQHGQPAVGGVGVVDVADAAALAVGVQRLPARGL